MSKKVFIFVNGILTFPGSADNWNGKAVTWTHLHTDARAEKVEYFIGAITRRFFQKKRAKKLCKMLHFYREWEVVLAGHSNGCDVILDALNLAVKETMEVPKVKEIHLFSGACKADFEKLGVNSFLRYGRVGRVITYSAGKDWALKMAGTYTGRWLLGYGTLGATGPKNVQYPHQVEEVVEPEFGHSDWFNGLELDRTMRRITGVDA